MEKNKEKKEIFCNFEYFMKNKCNGCKLERLCDEWGRNRSKRDSDNYCINYIISKNKEVKLCLKERKHR